MEVYSTKDNKPELHKLKDKTVQLMDYGSNFLAFVTTDNFLYLYYLDMWYLFGDEEMCFIEINFNYGHIQTLFCDDENIFIINEDNIIYKISSDCFANTEISNMLLNDYENDKIKFIRTKIILSKGSESIFVTNNNLYFIDKSLQLIQRKMKLNVCIKDLQCGISHMVLLDNNGFIYGMGCGKYFGLQNEEMSENFLLINLSFKVIKIICVECETIILNEYNELFGVGKNTFGTLGLGHTQPITVFTKIVINGIDKVKNIYGEHSVFGTGFLISSYNDDIYIVGRDRLVQNIFTKENLKCDTCNTRNRYYLDTFTKVEIPKSTKKFMYPFLMDSALFVLRTDYIINRDEEKSNFKNCFTKLKNSQLCDLQINILL